MGVESGTTKDDFDDYFHSSIYTLIRDKQSSLTTDPTSTQPPPQVSISPNISPNISAFLYWVKIKLNTEDCVQCLFEGGEKLCKLGEKKAAESFYANCIDVIDTSNEKNNDVYAEDRALRFKTLKYVGRASEASEAVRTGSTTRHFRIGHNFDDRLTSRSR